MTPKWMEDIPKATFVLADSDNQSFDGMQKLIRDYIESLDKKIIGDLVRMGEDILGVTYEVESVKQIKELKRRIELSVNGELVLKDYPHNPKLKIRAIDDISYLEL